MERAYRLNDIVQEKFYRLPAALFASSKYRELSAEAKLTYALLLDRMFLSQKYGWVDEDGDVYIVYRRDELAEILNISARKTTGVFQELTAAELLVERRVGLGQPNRLYVLKTELNDEEAESFSEKSEPTPSASFDQEPPNDRALSGSENTENPDAQKMRIRPANFAHQTRRICASDPQNLRVPYTKDNNIKHTTMNQTECNQTKNNQIEYRGDSIPFRRFPTTGKGTEANQPVEQDSVTVAAEQVKADIDYDQLVAERSDDRERLDEIVEIIAETVSTSRKTVRIASDDYPAELVKKKFRRLDRKHISFVLDNLRRNTTDIRDVRQYIRAALFNAPSTIGLASGNPSGIAGYENADAFFEAALRAGMESCRQSRANDSS